MVQSGDQQRPRHVDHRQLHDRLLDIGIKRVPDPAVRKEYERLQELARVLDNVEGKKTFIFDVDGTLTMMNYQRIQEMGLTHGDETLAAKIACSVPSCLGLKQAFELIKAHGHKVGVFSRINDPLPILFHLEQMGVGLENVDYVAITGAGKENYADVAKLKRAFQVSGKHEGKSIAPTRALIRLLYPSETTDLYTYWKERFGIEFVDVSAYGLAGRFKYSMLQVLAYKQREVGQAQTILDEDLILIGDSPDDTIGIPFGEGKGDLRMNAIARITDEFGEIPVEALKEYGHILSDETAEGKRTILLDRAPGKIIPQELSRGVEYEFVPFIRGRVAGVQIGNYAAIKYDGNAVINSIPKAMSVALALSEQERGNTVLTGVLDKYGGDMTKDKSTEDGRVKCFKLEALPASDVSPEYVIQLKLAPKFEEV